MIEDRALARFEQLFGPEFGHGRALDLQPLRDALDRLSAPHAKLPPIVHIAGTNGKGSTLAMLRAIAEAAGLKVHVYSKPHLVHLRERFRVAGPLVSDETLIAAAERVAATGADLSQFEALIAAAFLLFAQTPADLTLLETGFGGRDDATNVIAAPKLVLITPIDLDHQDILGHTRADIARHKAGIIKPGAPVISARQHEDALPVLEAAAEQAGAPLLLCGRDWDAFARGGRLIVQTEHRLLDLLLPGLHGGHQIDNAGLAVMAALTLADARIDDDALAAGVANARWPGRLQPIAKGALAARIHAAGGEVWIDGGHNPHAARALANALAALNARAPRNTIAIVALRARKDGAAFIEALAPALDQVIAIPLPGETSVDPHALVEAAHGAGIAAKIARDLDMATTQALLTPAPRILICGSLSLAGAVLSTAGAID